MRTSRRALVGLFPLTAFLVAGCGSATSAIPGAAYGTSPASPLASASASAAPASASAAPMIPAKTMLTVRKTKIGYVLANATGRTVYWYSRDVKGSGKSSCTGACLSAWPAVTGMPEAASGVKLSGKLGSITRSDGVVQATYNGYPLYTYAADMAPGDTTGNGVGGQWHVITGTVLSPSPASAAAASTHDISAAQPGTSASATPSGMMSSYKGGY